MPVTHTVLHTPVCRYTLPLHTVRCTLPRSLLRVRIYTVTVRGSTFAVYLLPTFVFCVLWLPGLPRSHCATLPAVHTAHLSVTWLRTRPCTVLTRYTMPRLRIAVRYAVTLRLPHRFGYTPLCYTFAVRCYARAVLRLHTRFTCLRYCHCTLHHTGWVTMVTFYGLVAVLRLLPLHYLYTVRLHFVPFATLPALQLRLCYLRCRLPVGLRSLRLHSTYHTFAGCYPVTTCRFVAACRFPAIAHRVYTCRSAVRALRLRLHGLFCAHILRFVWLHTRFTLPAFTFVTLPAVRTFGSGYLHTFAFPHTLRLILFCRRLPPHGCLPRTRLMRLLVTLRMVTTAGCTRRLGCATRLIRVGYTHSRTAPVTHGFTLRILRFTTTVLPLHRPVVAAFYVRYCLCTTCTVAFCLRLRGCSAGYTHAALPLHAFHGYYRCSYPVYTRSPHYARFTVTLFTYVLAVGYAPVYTLVAFTVLAVYVYAVYDGYAYTTVTPAVYRYGSLHGLRTTHICGCLRLRVLRSTPAGCVCRLFFLRTYHGCYRVHCRTRTFCGLLLPPLFTGCSSLHAAPLRFVARGFALLPYVTFYTTFTVRTWLRSWILRLYAVRGWLAHAVLHAPFTVGCTGLRFVWFCGYVL